MVPGIYIGTLLSISDKRDRSYLGIMFVVAILLSIIAGNPLPLELMMLFTSPFLLIFYLVGVGVVSATLSRLGAYLGFSSHTTNTIVAMPGSFPDFIINIRNSSLIPSIKTILIVGLAAFAICVLVTIIYYRILAFDFVRTGKTDQFIYSIIDSVGGDENIVYAGAGLFKLNIYLKDPAKISIEKVHDLDLGKVSETKDGLSFETGTSAFSLAKKINKAIR